MFVSGNSLEQIKTLPDIHRDPFDRLLIAMAQENNLTIITKNSKNHINIDRFSKRTTNRFVPLAHLVNELEGYRKNLFEQVLQVGQ